MEWDNFEKLFHSSNGNYHGILEETNGLKYLLIKSLSKGSHLSDFLNFMSGRKNNCISRDYSNTLSNFSTISKKGEKIFHDFTAVEIICYIKYVWKNTFDPTKNVERFEELKKVDNLNWGNIRGEDIRAHLISIAKNSDTFDNLRQGLENSKTKIQNWLYTNWFRFNSSGIFEDIFCDHDKVIPSLAKIKHIDFFINEIPYDLKTLFKWNGIVDHYRKTILKIQSEESYLKKLARNNNLIFIDSIQFISVIQNSTEKTLQSCFKNDILDIRNEAISYFIENTHVLAKWLYENQGIDRFGNENRLFLCFFNKQNMNESIRLLFNFKNVKNSINNYLDNFSDSVVINNLEFNLDNKTHRVSKCSFLFIQS